MDSSRAAMYAALLLAVVAAAAAAPQFQNGGGFDRFPSGPPGPPGRPVFYDDDEEDSSGDELSFFQRMIRPWRWFDGIFDYFSSDEEEEEIYDEGGFPGRFPGQQVARLDQRPQFRPQADQQRYVPRRPAADSEQYQTARSDSAVYQPAQLAAEAMHTDAERVSSEA